MQKAILFIALLLATTPGISQDSIVKPKKFDHYIGLQANELLRQLVSLSDNNTEINNPYLLTYTLLASKHQVGIQLGFGFDVNESKDLTSPEGKVSNENAIYFRAGVAKYFHLGKRWEASVGADYVRNYEEETINSTSVVDNGSSSDSTVSYSSRITEGSGGGLQLGLNYRIAPGILLGTESTMYLISSDQKENTTVKIYSTFISFPQFDNSSLSSDNLHTEEKSFRISIPVAIFLRVKF